MIEFQENFLIQNEILCLRNSEIDELSIQTHLKRLKLFRKGPYKLNEIFVPSQWNSYIKWKYLEPILLSIFDIFAQKKDTFWILDIGSNNGYYSFLIYYFFKKYQQNPRMILIDPVEEFYHQFLFLSQFLPEEDRKNFEFHKIGWENIHNLNQKYDLILCMGIFYHQYNPIDLFKTIHSILKTKGYIILETITVQLESYPLFLLPEKKYSGAKGIWFIPNKMAVEVLLKRLNFQEVRFHSERFIFEEMKNLEYLPGLEQVIDKKDKHFTIEGYPVPYRSFFSAKK